MQVKIKTLRFYYITSHFAPLKSGAFFSKFADFEKKVFGLLKFFVDFQKSLKNTLQKKPEINDRNIKITKAV